MNEQTLSLRQRLEAAKIQSDALDGLVHDAASREASRVNNEGMSEQLDYLERAGFSDEEILDELGVEP